MSEIEGESQSKNISRGRIGKPPLVVRVTDNDFQRDVLEKLSRLETKMDMLVGNTQPGRMKVAEDRIRELEHHEVRRNAFDRAVNAAIATAISVAIALRDHWFK